MKLFFVAVLMISALSLAADRAVMLEFFTWNG